MFYIFFKDSVRDTNNSKEIKFWCCSYNKNAIKKLKLVVFS
jgi:hypothetical protein